MVRVIKLISGMSKPLLCLVLALVIRFSISMAVDATVEDAILKENWQMVINLLENNSVKTGTPVAKLILGHACLATKRYNKAKLWFDSVKDGDDFLLWSEWNKSLLNRHPYNPIAIYLSADAMLRIGRIEKAIDGLKLALKKREDFELASEALMRINHLNNKYNQTISSNDKTGNENLTDNRAYLKTGSVYNKKNNSDKDNSDDTKYFGINAEDIKSDFNRGKKHHQKGEYRLAISDFTKTLELEKENYRAYRNRAAAFHKLGEYDKAISDFTMAIEENPNYPEAYNERGVVYYEIGQIDQAISDFAKAIESDSSYTNAYINRGVIYMKMLGDVEKGCADWKRACELGECRRYLIAEKQGDCE
ncbi:MAG: tetratricopeptide repeat protein [candidate division Zixibacteria bacterium]|nr:tetratricopeptide repeat protein [candidate division Zixibacteria bacterium]